MTIEELKAEWERLLSFSGHPKSNDYADAFAARYMDSIFNVLALADKAWRKMGCDEIDRCVSCDLKQALETLKGL